MLSAEVGTKHGLNVSGLVLDEVHVQPDRKLYDVLTKGSGDAREQPLYFLITTAGTDTNSICYALRGSAAFRGYDRKWQAARKAFLEKNPLCATCMRAGRLTPATVVDHIVPHRGDARLFWDEDNWQPLCKSCHDRKTGGGR